MHPVISIVVPIYNVARYLEDCLESVRGQTFQAFECICVDDGSTDGSGAIAERYAEMDERFCVINQKNEGLGAARNAGIGKARGEYLSFLDSDDFIHPRALETLYWYAVDYNSDIVGSNFRKVPESASPRDETSQIAENSEYVLSTDPLIDWLDGRLPLMIIAPGKLYKRKIFDDEIFPIELRIMEDTVTCPRFLEKSATVIAIHECLYFYRIRRGSLVNSQRHSEIIDATLGNCFRLREFAEEINLDSAHTALLYHRCAHGGFLEEIEQAMVSPLLTRAMRGEVIDAANKYLRELSAEGLASTIKFTRTRKVMVFLCLKCRQPMLFRFLLRWCHPREWKRIKNYKL